MNIAKLNSRNRRAGKKKLRIVPQTPTPPPPSPNGSDEKLLNLDLGCGKNKRQGFIGADILALPGVDVVCDFKDRFPWDDSTVDEIHCSHTLEHFGQFDRVHFLNEMWRIMKPGAKATVICPHWSSCRAYGDPSHQWPPMSEFLWYYVSKEWRKANTPHVDSEFNPKGFNCDFKVTWGYTLEAGVASRNQEYQQNAMLYWKEACQDIISTLECVK